MPYMTSTEVANDLGISVEDLYSVAAKLKGFFPSGKLLRKKSAYPTSMYLLSQHQLLGRTLELAPGNDTKEKIQAIRDGYELSFEEKTLLYQSPDMTTTLSERINEIWQSLAGKASTPRVTRKATELTPEFDGLNPDECRELAFNSRVMNPEQAYLLARRRDEAQALTHYLDVLQRQELEAGTKVSGNEIIDEICIFKPYLGQEFRRKGTAWRRFRSAILGTGKLKEPAKKGGTAYLVVPEA